MLGPAFKSARCNASMSFLLKMCAMQSGSRTGQGSVGHVTATGSFGVLLGRAVGRAVGRRDVGRGVLPGRLDGRVVGARLGGVGVEIADQEPEPDDETALRLRRRGAAGVAPEASAARPSSSRDRIIRGDGAQRHGHFRGGGFVASCRLDICPQIKSLISISKI